MRIFKTEIRHWRRSCRVNINLTLVEYLVVAHVPHDLGLGPSVPGPAAHRPDGPRVEGEDGLGVDQLEVGGRN